MKKIDSNRPLIVGAGPVGLTMALELASRGVASTLIDQRTAANQTGSRALGVDQYALEVFESLGLGECFLEEGVTFGARETYVGDELVEQEFAHPPAPRLLPPMINIPQYLTERILREKIAHFRDMIDLRWNHELSQAESSSEGTGIEIQTPESRLSLKVPFLIGADGARSSVRKLLNIDFPGFTDSSDFLIADVELPEWRMPSRRFTFKPSHGLVQTEMTVPQPHGLWRCDWQLFPGEDPEKWLEANKLASLIEATTGIKENIRVHWASSYRFHQRVADVFKKGSAFLIGDAAHLVAPFGGRGMNSGIRDAVNLAWKLARVGQEKAPVTLLDSYDLERRQAAWENQRVTREAMAFISPQSLVEKQIQDQTLASFHLPESRKKITSGRRSIPESYQGSPLNWGNHSLVGEKFPDFPLSAEMMARQLCSRGAIISVNERGVMIDGNPYGVQSLPFRVEPNSYVVVREDGYVGAVCSSQELGKALQKINGESVFDKF